LCLHLGILCIPDDEQRPQRDHHVGDRHRPGIPWPDVCRPARGHGGDVPDPDALFRRSLGYQVTSIVAGSLAPIIAVRLLETYKSAVPISWYLAATAAVSAAAAVAARETKGEDLADVDIADARDLAAHQDPAAAVRAP
jgi:hypothetical protein